VIGTHMVQKRRSPGDSWEAGLHKIAKQFGVGTGTVQRIAAQAV
jgi:hypothetical protein